MIESSPTLAAAPGGDHLLVATRLRGSAFKRSLVDARLGTRLEIEGPVGSALMSLDGATVTCACHGS